MTTNFAQVQAARLGETNLMADIIGDAFAGLAVSRFLIPDDAARPRMLSGVLYPLVVAALNDGMVWTDATHVSAAVWFNVPPGGLPEPPGYATIRARLLGELAGKFAAFEQAMHAHHPHGEPFWHLALLAVRPSLHGIGLGSALLAHHHRQLDHLRSPAYLEASSQDSRRLYLRHGYTDHGDPFPCAPGGPLLYPMVRHPSENEGSANL